MPFVCFYDEQLGLWRFAAALAWKMEWHYASANYCIGDYLLGTRFGEE
jgi:hypothetical protein